MKAISKKVRAELLRVRARCLTNRTTLMTRCASMEALGVDAPSSVRGAADDLASAAMLLAMAFDEERGLLALEKANEAMASANLAAEAMLAIVRDVQSTLDSKDPEGTEH